jgi:hypothetical protein
MPLGRSRQKDRLAQFSVNSLLVLNRWAMAITLIFSHYWEYVQYAPETRLRPS